MNKIKKILLTLILVVVTSLILAGCTDRKDYTETKYIDGYIRNISDISKTYDGEPVNNPTYETNNLAGDVAITYYVRGQEKAIDAPVNVGEYTVKISIAECYNIRAVEEKTDFTISKAVFSYTVPESLYAVSGDKLKDIDLSSYNLAWVNPEMVVSEAGMYEAYINFDRNNYYAEDRPININIKLVGNIVSKPTLNLSFDYDEAKHTVSISDIEHFDTSVMEIVESKSVMSAKATGIYTIVVRLKDAENNCWDDRTNDNIILTWKIGSFSISCVSGTPDCYEITTNENGETTIVFRNVAEKSEYSLSGEVIGNIIIDAGDENKFELSLTGATITSSYEAPIVILSGDEVTVSAKKETSNYINDNRDKITDEALYASSIYAKTDLVIGGKGTLTIVSKNNNGIHTKDDLEVKNLTLNVTCIDNALKGNDSVTIKSGNLKLIAKQGDGIKTSNTDLSSKDKQRGTVSIQDGIINIFAACDGIDAAYNVEISGGVINIYTDKYSEYSEEVTSVSGGIYYIRTTSKENNYSIKYFNDENNYVWKNAQYYTSQSSGGRPGQNKTYYYYKIEKPAGYSNMLLYVYSSNQAQGQDSNYTSYASLVVNNNYDTLAISQSNVSWTNYSTTSTGGPGGFGGPNNGNTNKSDHSTKGLKADNEINISGGILTIKAYDDAIHTNSDVVIESTSKYGTGNITISGGSLILYSNDDGIHADGILTINDGTIRIINSYEGLEGKAIHFVNGDVSVVSTDDGVNATTTSGDGIIISGGTLYIYAGGDGLDANSKTKYRGIVFEGGQTVVINTTSMNSPIDTEAGYTYTKGIVVAIGPSNSMWNESINCSNFSSVGCYKTNVSASKYIVINGVVQVQMPKTMTSVVIVLGAGSSNSIIQTTSDTSNDLNLDGIYWIN